jgi:isovaleryl-CoA dehydrogenase
MASIALPFLLRTSARSLRRSPNLPAFAPAFARNLSTKHPAGFEPPTEEDLLELRERVQEFTRMGSFYFFFV